MLEYGIMKMIFCVVVYLSIIFSSMQAFACSLDKGQATGGACSVKDIQNLEKNKVQEKVNTRGEKNLRPVKITPEIKNPEQAQCIFCLQEGLFEKIKP